ncbi:MAG TPA: zinc-ribbon domain-containing protein [Oscillospiraceae bacterium]|nr:zinc-ribbon domain-containing protein [Oscillospiraceae bacterium]HPF55391.1 zinc-ribbon domain-containing protein [Clostridiales bacterium]HPK35603.1 zinc-ribbon domain-containing protein [Oscillospiraceae bacterium]HPR74667.1 zinc-ribbon domain-containing protein [Oscillospiraceae bacterium]
MYCPKCGSQIDDGAKFCGKCGEQLTEPVQPVQQQAYQPAPQVQPVQQYQPQNTGLIGWSENYRHPLIVEKAEKQKKGGVIFSVVLMAVFLIGFTIAGFAVDDMSPVEGIIVGVLLALMTLIILLVRMAKMKKPIWEGTVTDKKSKRKTDTDNDGNISRDYIQYTVYITGVDGSKKKITTNDNRVWYDYLQVGERVRFHPNLGTYEKYDKSRDSYLMCNVCGKRCDISEDVCRFCKSPLFKGSGTGF